MKRGIWGLCALFAIGLAGCSEQQKVEANNTAKRAESDIKQAAANAQKGLSEGSVTFKVKSAMSSSDKLDTSGINVDTKEKVVYLKGLVTSPEQKALAERIAKDTVGNDVRVVSELAIRPKAQPTTVK